MKKVIRRKKVKKQKQNLQIKKYKKKDIKLRKDNSQKMMKK